MTATNAIVRQKPSPRAGRESGPCTQPAAPEAMRKKGLRDDRHAAALARKYVWWQDPRLTLADPRLLIAQVMTLGTLDDVRWLIDQVPANELRQVLREPPIGIFNERSWRFWHLRLDCRPIPPLPARSLPRPRWVLKARPSVDGRTRTCPPSDSPIRRRSGCPAGRARGGVVTPVSRSRRYYDKRAVRASMTMPLDARCRRCPWPRPIRIGWWRSPDMALANHSIPTPFIR